jgi:protein-disulfide isomerase
MNRRVLILATLAVATLAVAAVFVLPRLGGGGASAEASQFALDQQPRKGPADAPIEVVVFEDFLCPHCATFAETVAPRIERDYVAGGQVAYYVKNFVVMGPESERIASVGECVAQQGHDAYWAFEQVAYRSQSGLDRGAAIDLARQYVPGLDGEALDACLSDGSGLEAVRADNARAQALGIRGTPTVFVDGEQVRGTYAEVAAAIDAALAARE